MSIDVSTESEDHSVEIYQKCKKNTRDDVFYKELKVLPFPDNIKNEAFNIYKLMNLNIKRRNNRLGLKYFCIYNAYTNLNQAKDPVQLAKNFGLQPDELHKIFKMFSTHKTKYKMKSITITPLNYIKEYYENTGLRLDEINGIIEFANSIVEKSEVAIELNLEEDYPQEIAASIIVFYMSKMYNILPPTKFYDYINISDTKLNKMINKIGIIYNS